MNDSAAALRLVQPACRSSAPRLSVDHRYKSLDATEILRDVTFSLADNEFVALLGPSGAGKTTLLKCIAGITRIDSLRSNALSGLVCSLTHSNAWIRYPEGNNSEWRLRAHSRNSQMSSLLTSRYPALIRPPVRTCWNCFDSLLASKALPFCAACIRYDSQRNSPTG